MSTPDRILPPLKTSVADAKAKIEAQIAAGEKLRARDIQTTFDARYAYDADKKVWTDYAAGVLDTIFDSDEPAKEFRDAAELGIDSGTAGSFISSDRRAILNGVTRLRSLAQRLNLISEPSRQGTIPIPVIAEVASVFSQFCTHAHINNLMRHARIPGNPPPGNKVERTREWLQLANTSTSDPLASLGSALTEFMEVDTSGVLVGDLTTARERIHEVLKKYGFAYRTGGRVVRSDTGPASRALQDIIRARDLPNIEAEFDRIVANVEKDPPAAVTAASALLEALFQQYITDKGLEMPSDKSIKPLWNVVRKNLHLDPAGVGDEDLRKILSGMASIVDGVGSLRTHKGSAHGQSTKGYKLKPRHARLAVHAASTLATFIIETWEERKR